ncbi:hypothetical protein [Zhengella mangrovi]|uniref:hypothetical protein n=1 Tax=Zhengella mangrovi TaxID=1982044 RepID=UPI0010549CF6|nr:hypothetical protein [Zhengella mangrovi]
MKSRSCVWLCHGDKRHEGGSLRAGKARRATFGARRAQDSRPEGLHASESTCLFSSATLQAAEAMVIGTPSRPVFLFSDLSKKSATFWVAEAMVIGK